MEYEVSSETLHSEALPDHLLIQSRSKSTSIKAPLLWHTRDKGEQMGNSENSSKTSENSNACGHEEKTLLIKFCLLGKFLVNLAFKAHTCEHLV